jgi:hypothetical protein
MITQSSARGALFAAFLFSAHGLAVAADSFPFDRELLLDATPMRPGKRMPILTVEENGTARLDLWCRTVPARVEISDMAIKIEPGPLPEDLPTMQSAGQCTPERVKADEEILAAFSQVTGWRRQGEAIVLEGTTTLRFRASDH